MRAEPRGRIGGSSRVMRAQTGPPSARFRHRPKRWQVRMPRSCHGQRARRAHLSSDGFRNGVASPGWGWCSRPAGCSGWPRSSRRPSPSPGSPSRRPVDRITGRRRDGRAGRHLRGRAGRRGRRRPARRPLPADHVGGRRPSRRGGGTSSAGSTRPGGCSARPSSSPRPSAPVRSSASARPCCAAPVRKRARGRPGSRCTSTCPPPS